MGELVVIFDRDKEVAALVDMEDRIGRGPAMIGPSAGDMLEAFLQTIPYDLTGVSSYELRRWFEQFAGPPAAPTPPPAAETPAHAVDGGTDTDVADAELAERESVEATSTPPPQPADADTPEPAPQTASVVQTCPACNGTGNVPGAEEGQLTTCNLCTGSGRVTIQAPA